MNANKYQNRISYYYFNENEPEVSNDDQTDDMTLDDDDDTLKELNHEQIVTFLQQQIEPPELSAYLVRVYLQYCIYIWNDTSAILNNLLIDMYKFFVEKIASVINLFMLIDSKNQSLKYADSYRHMLKYFLYETQAYESAHALGQLDLDNYAEERAIVLGKMGKHHDALDIYVNRLNDIKKAENYCETIYAKSDIIDSKQVYLLTILYLIYYKYIN